MSNNRILITGGHATPAFAVLDELIKENKYDFIWVGEKYNQRGNKNSSAEFQTVNEKYNIKFIEFKSGKLLRAKDISSFFRSFYEFYLLSKGFVSGFILILVTRPNLILTFGGFSAVPIAFWGRVLGKKVITHEQTIVSGLANRIISKFAHKILVSWENSLNYFPKDKTVLTGNPIRKDIFENKSNILNTFDQNLPIIFITGGNQGAHEINKRVFEIIDKLLDISNVIHQTGNSTITNDFNFAIQHRNKMDEQKQKHYLVKEYISPEEIGEVMNKATLVVSRSGANTICEVLALGKLTICIPIPWASANEQDKNANILVDIGLGKNLKQDENLTSEKLLAEILKGLDVYKKGKGFNNEDLSTIQLNSKKLVNFSAAENIANIINEELA